MNEKTIGYLGPVGTYCEMAALSLFGKHKLSPYSSISAVIQDVAKENISTGILPMENLLEGTVIPVLDGLNACPAVKISGETVLKIEHHLMANQGITKEQLTGIFSHPQALAQCREYLKNNFSHLPCIPIFSTAEAARRVALDLKTCGAIANRRAGEIYGLEILDTNISDVKKNLTRFIVINRTIPAPTGRDKTSLAFSLEHRPGTLAKILGLFAQADINLTKIESRPSRKVMGEYIFYVDFEGHVSNSHIKKLLKVVRKHASYLSVLGSYPMCPAEPDDT